MSGGDGLLNHDVLPGEKGPQDACGVFGVWAPGEEVAKLSYFGLYALQHRGQESAGIATSDGKKILIYKDMGLVSQVFNENALNTLTGHIAVGHTRYSTTGASSWQNAQPTLGRTASGTVALGHNGNLTNTAELLSLVHERYPEASGELSRGNTTDTAVVTALLTGDLDHTLEATALEVLPRLRGAFCFVFMDETTLYAARDPQGVRPLVLGRLERGWVVASETAALDIVGASFVREVEPGEFISIDENGLRSRRFAEERRAGCVFEYVYLARPDTTIAGRGVYEARVEMGRRLAQEYPVEADLVIPTPESGTPAAIGYAQASGIPFGQGLVKNSYVGRTFIQPSQTIRQRGIKLKLNPLKDIIHGKRLIVVDDSIVRGNTQRALVSMLREAGAAEVHVRISSPPITWPCFYGIDFATRAELIATGLSVDEIRQAIGADSLGFVSEEGMIAATEQPRERLCTACFTGNYPIPLPEAHHLGKNLLERTLFDDSFIEGEESVPARAEVSGRAVSGGAVSGRAVSSVGVTSVGVSDAGVSDAGVSDAGVSGAGVSGAGVSGATVSGAGVSGAAVSGAGVSGAGAAVSAAGVSGTSAGVSALGRERATASAVSAERATERVGFAVSVDADALDELEELGAGSSGCDPGPDAEFEPFLEPQRSLIARPGGPGAPGRFESADPDALAGHSARRMAGPTAPTYGDPGRQE